ncbi:MAG: carnitine dehydratase [Microbacterium sp. 67-17]|jgi:crotonobetainyl-CoA:carnitine CoA-transferase CaiB-like acyl-CoA transferase|uniref:CaiB/BaiF CoA transferase family protein n=1 Tax=Microbacterium sp. 67-17 TaxID=1895782 RepID=UPI00095B6C2F|nr:CoA transferase [Microbacterium sp. 67-17]OJW02548.1 MAG: carnitine dehydratase [Microbacterium sp. 67-17]
MPGPMPLDGVVVADLSRVLAGPLAASTLADLGADVIKVERAASGDDTRQWGPPWTGNSSSYFESANRGKRSIALDFGDPADLDLARRLVSRADVVIENFLPGTLDRFGLDYESVRALNPAVVYASITGFGSQAGARDTGYDFLVQAVGGLMDITGPPGSPSKVGVAIVDVLSAKDATVAILAALHERARSGLGQHVEVALLSSLLAALVNQGSGYLATGHSPRSLGNRHPSIAPYEALDTGEGVLALAVGNDAQFARLCETVGDPDLAGDARFATNAQRVAHRDELAVALEARLRADTAASWAARLMDAGVPAGTIGSVADGFVLAERLGLDPRVPVDGGIDQIRSPLRFERTPIGRYVRPPRLDEHGDEIRRWLAAGPDPIGHAGGQSEGETRGNHG